MKPKKCKLKKHKKQEQIEQLSTDIDTESDSDKGVKPHGKITIDKLTGGAKMSQGSKGSKKPATVSVPMDDWEAIMDFIQ